MEGAEKYRPLKPIRQQDAPCRRTPTRREKTQIDLRRRVMEGTAALQQNVKDGRCWRGFKRGSWCAAIDVRDFIACNVSPYAGDESFLVAPSKRTQAVWEKLQPYFQEERKKGVLAVDAKTPSTLTAHKAGYPNLDCREGAFAQKFRSFIRHS